MEEKRIDPSAPPVMPPPYDAQQAYPGQLAYPPTSQPGYPPTSQPGYPAQPGYAPPGYPPQPPVGAYPPPGYPPQPGYPVSGQSPAYPQGYAAPANVVIQQPPTTIVVPPQHQLKPPNNLALALIACLCCNGCCLGLVALIFALRSDSAYSEGRIDDARRKGETAKKCAIAAIVVAIILAIVITVANTLLRMHQMESISAFDCYPNCDRN